MKVISKQEFEKRYKQYLEMKFLTYVSQIIYAFCLTGMYYLSLACAKANSMWFILPSCICMWCLYNFYAAQMSRHLVKEKIHELLENKRIESK